MTSPGELTIRTRTMGMSAASDVRLSAVGRHGPEHQRLGATLLPGGRCAFCVWAPRAQGVSLRLLPRDGNERIKPMVAREWGYFQITVDNVQAGDRYLYRLHQDHDRYRDRPDPASRYQPGGVHGPSQIVDPAAIQARPVEGLLNDKPRIFYELHVGTFTEQGTFDAAIEHLDELVDLGVTMVELMPIGQFPGRRNWGYDGVLPFAVQNSYGGPAGLTRFVDACHERQLGVALDVVYNHLGPEGNYLGEFGDYFSDKYRTPWGDAVNFDEAGSDQVRRYFIENALMWVDKFQIDALRLDAVHAIFDQSAYPFLQELTDAVHNLGAEQRRQILVIAESDLNDPRLVRLSAHGGLGMDGQWADDLHHALHALLTGERDGYYRDFGLLRDLGAALNDAYVYQGQYSQYRKRRHGAPPRNVLSDQFVVCAQNHDQVGNRALGERLRSLVTYEQYQLATAVVLLSPFVPLLFMGEEHAETRPFLYFVSHSDPELMEAVRQGRIAEFAGFGWDGELPDPQSEETFAASRIDRSGRARGEGAACLRWYKALIAARKLYKPLAEPDHHKQVIRGDEAAGVLTIHRWCGDEHVLLALNFSAKAAEVQVKVPAGQWKLVLHSREERFCRPRRRLGRTRDGADGVRKVQAARAMYGSGLHFQLSGHSFALYQHVEGR